MRPRLPALLAAAALLAGCADRAPTAPAPGAAPPPATSQRFDCIASVREGRVGCAGPGAPSSARYAIIGGQGSFIRIASTNVAFDSASGTFQADFTVQNLLPFPMGTADGVSADSNGVRVFFNSGPTVTSGWGTITVQNADGTDVFTTAGQPYFRYPGILAAGQTSAPRTWQFHVDPDVAFFGFTLLVDTRVPPVLQIHEIMAHPTTASEPAGEWFEVYNRGKEAVDLQGWTIASGGDAGHVVTASLLLPVGGRVVLSGSTSAAANGGAPVDYAYTGVDLDNGTADWLALRAPGGLTVDSVDWGAAPGDVAAAPPTGASLQLADADSSNLHLSGATSAWHPAVSSFGGAGELGTPGGRNLFPLTGMVSLAAHEITTCATDAAGQAWCWGIHNVYGQMGDGTTGTHPAYAVPVQQPAGVSFVSTSLRHTQSCALSGTGKVWCWGQAVPVGPPLYELNKYTPWLLPQDTLVFTSLSHNCALTAVGQGYCWSEGGSDSDRGVVQALFQPAGVQFTGLSAAANLSITCGLTAAGQAWCQGRGYGVGIGFTSTVTQTDTFAAVHQPLGVRFQSISTNAGTTCAVSTIGQGFCWGTNTQGQVGDGTKTPRGEPVMVSHPASIRFTRIDVGKGAFTCGLSTAGQAYCWGAGPLGTGVPNAVSLVPVAVAQPAGVTFSSIASGETYACGLAAGSGAVYCWGEGGNGALGDGTTTDRLTPVMAVR